ncbi:putative Coiled-coil domain-containing protein [Helianthus annuus]|nr:putative Coiled-coil domain-containing protein [Helianthus annuus]
MAAYARTRTKLRSIPQAMNFSFLDSGLVSTYRVRPNYSRQISQFVQPNGKRLFLVDTLALVRRLEGEGVPSKQAEAITSAIIEVLNDSLENVAESFVSKGEMQRIEMTQDGNLGKFKSQVQSSQVISLYPQFCFMYYYCNKEMLT